MRKIIKKIWGFTCIFFSLMFMKILYNESGVFQFSILLFVLIVWAIGVAIINYLATSLSSEPPALKKQPASTKQKVDFYNKCVEELKKWNELRKSNSITEEEYHEKKEQRQYVNNSLGSISYVMKLIYDNVALPEFDPLSRCLGFKVEINEKYVGESLLIESPQGQLKKWLELRDLNGITEEEYQNLKEEFLKEEGINKNSRITNELNLWSELRDLNGITEEEYQKLKVYLLQYTNK